MFLLNEKQDRMALYYSFKIINICIKGDVIKILITYRFTIISIDEYDILFIVRLSRIVFIDIVLGKSKHHFT